MKVGTILGIGIIITLVIMLIFAIHWRFGVLPIYEEFCSSKGDEFLYNEIEEFSCINDFSGEINYYYKDSVKRYMANI